MDLHFEDNSRNYNSLKKFERMLKTNNILFFDSDDFEHIIVYYIDNGKIALAKKALDLAIEQHPGVVGIEVLRAEILIIEGKYAEAENLLDDLFYIEPENEEILIQKAMLASKQDDHEQAIDLLKLVLEMSEKNTHIDVYSMLGMEYLYLENFDTANNFFKQCLDIDSKDQTALYNVVYCYDMVDANEKAIEFLIHFIEKEPYNETAWHQLGREYYILKRYTEALDSFDYALVIDDKFIGAYLEKAKTLEKLERYSEAIRIYDLTTNMEDPSAFVYMRMAACYEALSKDEEAIEYYLMSSDQDPYLEKPIYALIQLYMKHERYQKAIYHINQLINLDDENIKYWRLYGDVNMKIGFFEEAAKSYERCVKYNDRTIDIHIKLADANYFSGQYKKAIQGLIAADVLYHRDVHIYLRLSGLYFLIKSNDLGMDYFDFFIRKNPKAYREFQKLFPSLHNSDFIKRLLSNYKLL